METKGNKLEVFEYYDRNALQNEILSNKDKFIETEYDRANAGVFDWLFSMGTNFTCYKNGINSKDDLDLFNNRITAIRTILYMIQTPFFSKFFYWVLIVFALHKFNFKKPIMKVIGFHYMFHVIGDMLNRSCDLLNDYYVNLIDEKGNYSCSSNISPLKWFIGREIAMISWYVAEIIGDWYPLLRTRAVVKNEKIIWLVYITCGIFNLSKVAKVVLYCSRGLRTLYNVNGAYDYDKEGKFFVVGDIIELVILFTAVLYDLAVYIVLKKCIFNKGSFYKFGFLKKFENLSEYRILLSSLFSLIFLPFIFIGLSIRFYYIHRYYGATKLNFTFEDAREFVTHVQYFMIYIDQIFLTCFKNESTISSSNNNSGSNVYKSSSKSFGDSKMKFSSQLNNSNTYINSMNSLNDENERPNSKYDQIIRFNLNNNDSMSRAYKINSSGVSKKYYDNILNHYSNNNNNTFNYNNINYNNNNFDGDYNQNYDKYPFNYDNKNY